jgi:uncharacterized protein YbjT (DUF2867 family)
VKVIIFGATGMIGQGLLRECLADEGISSVLTLVRAATGARQDKLRELVHQDFFDYAAIREELTGFDVCLFCLGTSAAGKSEEQYHRLTYELTVAAAEQLVALNPQMTFGYVSGQGTDSSEKGRAMWARVKGKTENRLLEMPFRAAYMFRPGYIQPLDGIRSKTRLYQTLYDIFGVFYPLLKWMAPTHVTDTRALSRAMVDVARNGYSKSVLETRDIHAVASR